ncbi:protein unc-13 homolog isoform X1 [Solanum pennellii]|uniref:Protein unc-13 homolog isoform X1 n=1 Tax=Solanum pennellii TaxID=28526 RepID=A0ABM1G0D8_SOLPN|nr:protein unc-13 homolog isoform X1 [Solanum pennellii]
MLFEIITKTLCSLIWKIACPYFHITNFANTLNVRINCYCPFEELSSLSKSQYLSSTQQQELTVEYIEDFDDDDDLDELDSRRFSRRVPMLLLILCLDCRYLLLIPLSSFKMYSFLAFTWMDGRYFYVDDHLRETAYEILLAAAGPSDARRPHCTIEGNKEGEDIWINDEAGL